MTLAEVITFLEKHRDDYYPDWSKGRGMLNFVLLLLKQVA